MMNVLGDEVKEVDSFLIVYKYKDRWDSQAYFPRKLCKHLYKMSPNHLVVCFVCKTFKFFKHFCVHIVIWYFLVLYFFGKTVSNNCFFHFAKLLYLIFQKAILSKSQQFKQ
jgi:hypothetical protein